MSEEINFIGNEQLEILNNFQLDSLHVRMRGNVLNQFVPAIIQFALTITLSGAFLLSQPAPKAPAITHRQQVQWFEFSKVLGRLNA
ncbi:hypothetical protein ACJ2_31110 [Pantoea sp. QMID2]|nr:hypothetical protein ACJ1_34520 [Pantoea sp. QMID1]GME44122.1 hypothetical protein ACJ3_34720 [Pantoea sp. QMID3]GME58788.1 hypothetical protein ACJ4_31030 [Pantoea sp. QMID4]GME60183.1 hypothetical protein ACJ2_31110 [Pantoea sp. QMID2]